MTSAKDTWIDSLLGQMNREQKAGQMMVFGWNGTVVTPDAVEMITKYHVGGIRVSQKARTVTLSTLHSYSKPGDTHTDMTLKSVVMPRGLNKDYSFPGHPPVLTIGQYAAELNRLRRYSLERELGIPVHFTIDQEGNGTDDLLGGARLFPYPMGIAGAGDRSLAYRVGLSIGKQAHAAGIDIVQMVLDVNTNPKNPEVGPRSFGETAEQVTLWGRELFRGLKEAGVTATGKHFPGRGESTSDAHWGLPVMQLDRDTLMNVHIAPFRTLWEEGLVPVIMVAHTIYPTLGEQEYPATMSRTILTDLVRGELGYQGVIGTDNMMMGGVIKQYEMSEAIVQALRAGCDLVLCRDESPVRIRILEKVVGAMKEGTLPERDVDDKVRRILGMRWDMGLSGVSRGIVDTEKAERVVDDPIVVSTARDAARKSIVVMRDTPSTLPLRPEQKVLLVEQVFVTQLASNNLYSRPGIFWEEFCRLSPNVGSVEIGDLPSDNDLQRVRRRLREDDYDVIVTTNYFHYKVAGAIGGLVDEFIATGKPVVVIANNPFVFSVSDSFPTVVLCYQPAGRENVAAVAEVVYGKQKAVGTIPFRVK